MQADISNLEEFRNRLLERDVYLIEASPVAFRFSLDGLQAFFFQFGRTKRLIQFTRLFATLLRAGVSITDALRLLAEEERDPRMIERIDAVRTEVEGGGSLSSAFGRAPDLFDPMYSRSVMAGERSGNLPAVLDRLLEYHRKRFALKKKVLTALIYPGVLAVVAFLAIIALITLIVPRFAAAFANMDVELPAYTRFVMSTSDFFVHWGWLLVLALIGVAQAIRVYTASPAGRRVRDQLMLRIPLIGKISSLALLAGFLRTLATMLRGGIPLVEALLIAEKSLGNEIYAERMRIAIAAVESGEPLHACLRRAELFPDLLPKMVKIGEESGTLAEMLEEAAEYFDDEVDTLSTTMAGFLEPLMMILLAGVFLAIMLSIILPVFSAGSSIPG